MCLRNWLLIHSKETFQNFHGHLSENNTILITTFRVYLLLEAKWSPMQVTKFYAGMNFGSCSLQRHHFTNKGPSSQSYGFSSSHEWM